MTGRKLPGFEFDLHEPPGRDFMAGVEAHFGCELPPSYRRFMADADGGFGFVGAAYLVLWRASELVQFNQEYWSEEDGSRFLLFGSNGAGEGFAFELHDRMRVVIVPFMDPAPENAILVADSFATFFEELAKGAFWPTGHRQARIKAAMAGAARLGGDCQREQHPERWSTDAPTWADLDRAIRRLDARVYTTLTLAGPESQQLTVGGGAGRYVVFATLDNESFWHLVRSDGADGTATLAVLGHEGEFPARRIVNLETALKAAQEFLATWSLAPNQHWDER